VKDGLFPDPIIPGLGLIIVGFSLFLDGFMHGTDSHLSDIPAQTPTHDRLICSLFTIIPAHPRVLKGVF